MADLGGLVGGFGKEKSHRSGGKLLKNAPVKRGRDAHGLKDGLARGGVPTEWLTDRARHAVWSRKIPELLKGCGLTHHRGDPVNGLRRHNDQMALAKRSDSLGDLARSRPGNGARRSSSHIRMVRKLVANCDRPLTTGPNRQFATQVVLSRCLCQTPCVTTLRIRGGESEGGLSSVS